MTKTPYKQTPIGLIPADWEVKKLGEVGKVVTGNTPSRKDLTLWNGNFCWATAKDFKGKYIYDTTEKITEIGCKSARILPVGAVLITCIASIGNNAIAAVPLATNQQINSIIVSNDFSNEWLYYQLDFFKQDLELLASKTAVPLVNKSDFEKLKIPLPPLPEQQKIAEILSTWDKAIQETGLLIKKLEVRNKSLAFSLLTGKKRVKGFEGKWEFKNFGEITTKISRRNKGLIDAQVYSVTNTKGFVLQSEHFEGKVAGEDLSNYKIIYKNEFAYNPARINVGSLAYFTNEIGIISSLYVCFKTNEKVNDDFLLSYLQTNYVNARINALGEGGVRIYLWYELFSKIKINLPSLKEQTAIAEILNTAHQELKQYQEKLKTLQQQKKGLMQQLLTGKVRTV